MARVKCHECSREVARAPRHPALHQRWRQRSSLASSLSMAFGLAGPLQGQHHDSIAALDQQAGLAHGSSG